MIGFAADDAPETLSTPMRPGTPRWRDPRVFTGQLRVLTQEAATDQADVQCARVKAAIDELAQAHQALVPWPTEAIANI